MKCYTISHFDDFGNSVFKPKQQFDTLDSAISNAKKVNSDSSRKFKVVAYKCKYCYQYHVGKNGNVVTDRDRDKIKKQTR